MNATKIEANKASDAAALEAAYVVWLQEDSGCFVRLATTWILHEAAFDRICAERRAYDVDGQRAILTELQTAAGIL